MADNQEGIYNLTAPVIMAHPNLLTARPFKRNGKEVGDPKYGATFVFPSDSPDLAALKKLAGKVASEAWPGKSFKEIKWPFKNGTVAADTRKAAGKNDGEFQRGMVTITGRSKFAPRLSGIVNGKMLDLDSPELVAANKGLFYFGAMCLAQFNLVASLVDEKHSVTVYLNMVLSTGKGKKLSGGASASEVFKGYAGSVSTEDPTGADGVTDEEIPF